MRVLPNSNRRSAALNDAEARLAANRAALTARAQDLDAGAAQLAALTVERQDLADARAAFAAEQNAVASARADYDARLAAVSSRETDLSRRLAELDARAATVSRREAELAKREREAAGKQEAAEAALAQLAALREQIDLAQQTLGGGQRSLVPSAGALTPEPVRERFQVAFGQYHALLIGNQNYENPDWPDLDTSHNDVSAIGALLEDKYGFNVTILKDATRFDILKALSDLGDQLGEGDNLLIYFAGHGQYIDKISSGYWEPVDSIPYKTVNSISVQDVNAQLSLTKGAQGAGRVRQLLFRRLHPRALRPARRRGRPRHARALSSTDRGQAQPERDDRRRTAAGGRRARQRTFALRAGLHLRAGGQ